MSLIKFAVAILVAFATLAAGQYSPVNVDQGQSGALGNVTSTNSYTVRDLGFHGRVGKFGINTYGDTFHCQFQSPDTTTGCDLPLAANSASLDTNFPLFVTDFNLHGDGYPQPFVGYDYTEQPNSDWGMGLSNVIETGTNQGVVYFARNHRANAQGGSITGAGVAIVDASGSYPTTHRTATQWWDASSEPVYGDHGAADGNDGYVYVFGSMSDTSNIYVARALKSQATNLNSYQYWNGQQFTNDRLHHPSTSASVMESNQGTPFWSPFYNCWMYISTSRWNLIAITVRTAPKLTGPWSDETTLFESPVIAPGEMAYAPTVHTEYDTSGRTLSVSYTRYPNCQMAGKVTFQH